MLLILGAGCGVQQATAQYDNQGYNNNNQGYNNNGYGDQGYNNNYGDQGYNNQGYDNGYNNQGYNNGYNNNQGYDNNYYGYDNGNYQEFYNDLAPYGQWLSDPQYGYVWAPYGVGGGFRPYYTNGYWAMTEYGNTWVSNYPWGWAAFHYGRWAQSNYYGWIWIPGNTWGPAWVNWRQGGGYYGWAPMGPGISISISFGSGYSIPNPWWTFIPCGNIYARDYSRYYSPRQTINIINNTTIINNTYVDNRSRNTYVTGPRRQDIEAVTRSKVNVYQINNANRNGAPEIKGQNISIYSPTINRVNNAAEQAKIVPPSVKRLDASTVSNNGGGRAPARITAPAVNNANPAKVTTGQNVKTPINQTGRIQQAQPKTNQGSINTQPTQRVQQSAQETQRVQQQQLQQQRLQQQQQQQAQQQKIQQQQQVQQQRIQQQQQQAQQQQRIQQQQQQQVQQQRIQQQQQQQLQQQRAQQQQQAQQQQMQQQRAQQQQMQQQRAQQQQMQQQRVQQPAPQPRPAPAPQQARPEEHR